MNNTELHRKLARLAGSGKPIAVPVLQSVAWCIVKVEVEVFVGDVCYTNNSNSLLFLRKNKNRSTSVIVGDTIWEEVTHVVGHGERAMVEAADPLAAARTCCAARACVCACACTYEK